MHLLRWHRRHSIRMTQPMPQRLHHSRWSRPMCHWLRQMPKRPRRNGHLIPNARRCPPNPIHRLDAPICRCSRLPQPQRHQIGHLQQSDHWHAVSPYLHLQPYKSPASAIQRAPYQPPAAACWLNRSSHLPNSMLHQHRPAAEAEGEVRITASQLSSRFQLQSPVTPSTCVRKCLFVFQLSSDIRTAHRRSHSRSRKGLPWI